MVQYVGLQHITVLHIDRRGGIWLYLGLEVELSWLFGMVLMIPQVYSGLDALGLKDEAFLVAHLQSRLDCEGGLV